MTSGTVALLAGLFVVPLALLMLGHRLRRRTPRQRAIFWGGLVGYLVSASLALTVGMIPPEMWSPNDTWRGLLGFWAFIIGPAVGAALGMTKARRG